MKYEWENDIDADEMQNVMCEGDLALPGDLRIVGVVVADLYNVEGAFIPARWFKAAGIAEADIALDAMGDLDHLRLEALRVAGLRPSTEDKPDPLGR